MMVQFNPRLLLTLCLCAFALYLLCQRFDPQRLHGRILEQCVTGAALLTLWNLIVPFHLGANPLSAWLTGALGLPGIGLLAVLKLLD